MRRTLRACACVITVVVGAPPQRAIGQQEWSLIEDLRIGSESDTATEFSDIRGIAVGADGRIFVLDFQTQTIRMFDANGRLLKRIARRGGGPGEIRAANGMAVARNGDLWVDDPGNGRFSVFSAEGEFLTQHPMVARSVSWTWDAALTSSGDLYEFTVVGTAAGRQAALLRFASDGSVRDTLAVPPCASKELKASEAEFEGHGPGGRRILLGIPYLVRPVTVLDAQGTLWCSSRDRYEVLRLGLPGLDTLARIERDDRPLPIARAERDAAVVAIREIFRRSGAPEPDYTRIPRVRPAIEQLDVDDQGRVWVRRASSDTAPTHFDVWDSAGRLVAVATLPVAVSGFPEHVIIRADRMYAVVVDQNDVPRVIRARIRR